MKAAEILRGLLNILDAEETEQPTQPVVININNGQVADPTSDEEVVPDNTGTFVPPLQQKIELMKKSQGVESVYDSEDESDEENDELDVIKRVAGIKPMDVFYSDDESSQG